MIPPIIQNQEDGEEITPADIFEVMNGICINCYQNYERKRPVMYVRLVYHKKLIWWHVDHCMATPKPYKRKEYKMLLPRTKPIEPVPVPIPKIKKARSRGRGGYYNTKQTNL